MTVLKKWIAGIFILFTVANAQQEELRGTWVAWAGTAVPSTKTITEIMDSLAAANFNIVYVDVWRYGYPYFRSKVFHDLTGLYTDPSVESTDQPSRDILAEMLVEAHRVGLEVEAWFESGFNGAASTNGPVYWAKRNWFAQKQDGTMANYGQAGPSMIQCHPEVQQFLIDLCKEAIINYDIDGIDMDRIRYPDLDCGYDLITVNLYKDEHGGSEPPTDVGDAEWMQWRADKLTEFMGRMYDSLKTTNADINISNAPLPWGPEQFCQDWAPWINNGYLDVVVPQMYYTTNSTFTWRLDTELQHVDNDELMYPGISTTANGYATSAAELENMINTTRSRGLHGNVIWYHANLIWSDENYLSHLRNTVYSESADIPYRDTDHRKPAIIIDETSENVQKTSGWNSYSGAIPLYDGSCVYTAAGSSDTIRYFCDIPESGWYELYVFVNRQIYAAQNAAYTVYSSEKSKNYTINQRYYGNAGRWEKLGDFLYQIRNNQLILELSADSANGNNVFADAVMLLNTNRPEKYIQNIKSMGQMEFPKDFQLFQNYPNPFNVSTTIDFYLQNAGTGCLDILDITGRKVREYSDLYFSKGRGSLLLTLNDLPSALYLYKLTVNQSSLVKKMLLLK